jgi:metallo-beta-lactamase family protein
LLPKLVRDGFRGRVYCTGPTAEIAEVSLLDAAQIMEEDAETKRRRHEREGRRGPYPEVPLYTTKDAEVALTHFSKVRYDRPVRLGEGVVATFRNAGHVLGSANIEVAYDDGDTERTVLFSGDVGRHGLPILKDPDAPGIVDYLVVESTYGNRTHASLDSISGQLEEVINSTLQKGGNILIPSFALERTQEVLYFLNQLLVERRIPRLPVYLDGPMAISITEIFEHHPELFDAEMMDLIRRRESPFDFPGLKLVRTAEESKKLNSVEAGAIIIAGSGMCTGGRIKHHLTRNIHRPECSVLFVGFQARGTLGRLIVDGAPEVRILGQYYTVRARIEPIEGFSGHADQDELLSWLSAMPHPPKKTFVVHGEYEAAEHFAWLLERRLGWATAVPGLDDRFELA